MLDAWRWSRWMHGASLMTFTHGGPLPALSAPPCLPSTQRLVHLDSGMRSMSPLTCLFIPPPLAQAEPPCPRLGSLGPSVPTDVSHAAFLPPRIAPG